MNNNYKTFNPINKVALLMPPSVSASWIVDLLQKFGGTVIELEDIMVNKEIRSDLEIKQYNPELVTDQQQHFFLKSDAKYEIPAPTTIVYCLVKQEVESDEDNLSSSLFFYESGDFFWIGKKNRLKPFKKIKGLQFIHYLLQYPNIYIDCATLYQLGKTAEIPGTDTMDMIGDQLTVERKLFDFTRLNKYRTAIKRQIEEIEIELEENCFVNPEEKIEKENQLKMLKSALKARKMNNSKLKKENGRTNIQKNIQRALNKIHKIYPDLERYLNESTIKTGYSCSYRPLLSDPVEWILFHK